MGNTYRGITQAQRLTSCKEFARSKGGDCLSSEYKNTSTKMIWRCKFGHEWKSIPINVMYKNKWCPICAGNAHLKNEDAQNLAKSKGGKCLTIGPIKSALKLKWKCQFGHEWNATYNNIQQGSWCPYCLNLFGETVVRLYFEKYFGRKFPKIRPVWLNGLELDGYNEHLSIAFEYNGPQHYDCNSPFYDESIKLRDNQKLDYCNNLGIKLINIDYIPKNNIQSFIDGISNALSRHGFEQKDVMIDLLEVNPYKVNQCKELAKDHNGECLSNEYLGYDNKMHWRCKFGHEWFTTMYLVQKGHWCPKCSRSKRAI